MAEYGCDELLLATLACSSVAYALAILVSMKLAFLPLIPFAIVLWFFRDPERTGPQEPDTLLAPADGTVTDIMEVDEFEFIQGNAVRIGIFLSPLNVHVNRAPCAGIVRSVVFKAGEFLPAYNPKAPERNESITLGLELPDAMRIQVKQVSGILARRIICDVKLGETLSRGQRYGMIKFGSRTELYIPANSVDKILVSLGDKVKGGESVCCRLVADRVIK